MTPWDPSPSKRAQSSELLVPGPKIGLSPFKHAFNWFNQFNHFWGNYGDNPAIMYMYLPISATVPLAPQGTKWSDLMPLCGPVDPLDELI